MLWVPYILERLPLSSIGTWTQQQHLLCRISSRTHACLPRRAGPAAAQRTPPLPPLFSKRPRLAPPETLWTAAGAAADVELHPWRWRHPGSCAAGGEGQGGERAGAGRCEQQQHPAARQECDTWQGSPYGKENLSPHASLACATGQQPAACAGAAEGRHAGCGGGGQATREQGSGPQRACGSGRSSGDGGVAQRQGAPAGQWVQAQRVQHKARLVALRSELVAAERSVSSVKQLIVEAERELATLDQLAAPTAGGHATGVQVECICILDD
jgi:hypothetical protein